MVMAASKGIRPPSAPTPDFRLYLAREAVFSPLRLWPPVSGPSYFSRPCLFVKHGACGRGVRSLALGTAYMPHSLLPDEPGRAQVAGRMVALRLHIAFVVARAWLPAVLSHRDGTGLVVLRCQI